MTGPCVEGADIRPNNRNKPLAVRSMSYGHRRANAYRPGSKEAIIGNYFSKWIEAEAFVSIKDKKVV